jgi:hypothetical protein
MVPRGLACSARHDLCRLVSGSTIEGFLRKMLILSGTKVLPGRIRGSLCQTCQASWLGGDLGLKAFTHEAPKSGR